MPGLYDRLRDQLGDDDNDRPAGFSAFDLADLPPDQRRVMLGMLRDAEASTHGLTAAALRHKFATVDDLEDVLAFLTQHGWLIARGEEPVRYKVNLRRRRGSTIDADVWASLSSRLSDPDQPADPPPDEDRPPRSPSPSDW